MRSALIPFFLMAVMVAGCGESPRPTEAIYASPVAATYGKGSSTPVPLIVTVSDVDGSGAAYNIQSDGGGVYTDGTQNVQAVLDQYGTFAFNMPAVTRLSQIRWLSYNFNSAVDPANAYRPTPTSTAPYHVSTGPSSFSPFIPIQNLGINGNPSSECAYMGNSIANSTTTWRVSFHKGYEDVASSPTAFAVVTRSSVSPAVWTITPGGSCSPNSNVAALRSADGTVLFGYYNLPFFFTLAAK